MTMRRADAEPLREKLLRITIAPAQEVDDVERAGVLDQLGAGIMFCTADRLVEQRQRLPTGADGLGAIAGLSDAGRDGDAFRGLGACSHGRFQEAAVNDRHCCLVSVLSSQVRPRNAENAGGARVQDGFPSMADAPKTLVPAAHAGVSIV